MSDAVPGASRNDIRMDGVGFHRAAAGDGRWRLPAGKISYCIAVRRGRLDLEIDFPALTRMDLAEGDVVAISGLAPHQFVVGDAADESRPFALTSLADPVAGEDVQLIVGAVPSEILALSSMAFGPIRVRPSEFPDLARRLWGAVGMLEDEYANGAWIDRDLVVRRLAEIMLVNITRRLFVDRPRADSPGTPQTSRRLVEAISAFAADPQRRWTLGDLAARAGMSRTRFAEAFRLATGETPGRIVTRLRLTTVARRLIDEPLGIESAADAAGYSSAAAFVRAFQREFGDTPARWRRRRRGAEPLPKPGPPPSAGPKSSSVEIAG